jgi:ABC-type amino acid transport substrate-binding protein
MKYLAIILVFSFLPFSSINSEETLKAIIFKSRPWASLDKNNNLEGIVIKWLERLSTETNIPITINLGTVSRVYKELELGRSDISIEFKPDVTNKNFIPIAKITILTSKIFTQAINSESFKWTDLYKGTVCVVRGGQYGTLFTKDKKIKKHYVSNYYQLVNMLNLNRCKYVAAVESGFIYSSNQSEVKYSHFKDVHTLDKKYLYLIYSSKKLNNKIINKLKKSIKKLRDENFFQNYSTEYLKTKFIVKD